ncbi:hypothetical protein C8R32_10622 [Nitrosospira sp. Nsp5]|nr:hypothetical protein C8R32_10622 [Nitrosospira sp. Nsp5]
MRKIFLIRQLRSGERGGRRDEQAIHEVDAHKIQNSEGAHQCLNRLEITSHNVLLLNFVIFIYSLRLAGAIAACSLPPG